MRVIAVFKPRRRTLRDQPLSSNTRSCVVVSPDLESPRPVVVNGIRQSHRNHDIWIPLTSLSPTAWSGIR